MAYQTHGNSSAPTGVIALADGTVLTGRGFGAKQTGVGEVCFNTSMTGYQEVLTDPSYAGQIITFTFPHIGNTGANAQDVETGQPVARGAIVREDITAPANWRASEGLGSWLDKHDLPGVAGIDTRALTRRIRDIGAPNAVIAHDPEGVGDIQSLIEQARNWPGLDGMDLARQVSCQQLYHWDETRWSMDGGYGRQDNPHYHVVAVDYGAKHNILRCLASAGCRVTVMPATATCDEIMAHQPDGVFLSNGPGDPAATGEYAAPEVKKLVETGMPVFGICLGHQILARALGAATEKMHLGHRGANHPVKDLATGKVEITSQNHGFAVLESSLPEGVQASHVSLFDGSNEGLRLTDAPVFSVQYHPEASPGPQDSHYLFERFIGMIDKHAA